MFSLPLSDLIMLYLTMSLAPLALWWIWAGRRRRQRWRAESRRHVLCRKCGHRFSSPTGTGPPRCPHCGSENESDGGLLI